MDSSSKHLSDEQLDRFQELSPREAMHLESCAPCSDRLRELQSATAAYKEYRDSIRGPLRPPAPRPWRSLDALIAQHQASNSPRTFRWWPVAALAAASCVLIAVLVLYGPGEKASMRATDLLTQSSKTVLPEGRRLSIQTRGRTLIRPAVWTTDGAAEREPEMARLQMVFAKARYSWQDPLSARSFLAWRNTLKSKRDRVSMVRNGERQAYRVQTENPTGVLRTASLTLRAEDLRPTEGSFDFEGEGTVGLAEAAPPLEASPNRGQPIVKEAPVETPAGPSDTLRVLAALNEIGADVGEPVDVSIDPQHRHVVVRARGLSPQRQQEIAQVLKPLPRVVLDFTLAGSGPPPLQPAASERYSGNIPAPVRQKLEDRLGGAIALQEVTDQVLETSASVLARTHAVQVLAGKFPPLVEAGLSAPDKEILQTLRHRHVAELKNQVSRIQMQLKPLLGTSTASPPSQADRNMRMLWQTGVAALVASAEDSDALLNRLLAGRYSESSGEDMLRGLGPQVEGLVQSIQSQARGEQ